MNAIRTRIENLQGYLQIANAARKGQKIETVGDKNNRSYQIVING